MGFEFVTRYHKGIHWHGEEDEFWKLLDHINLCVTDLCKEHNADLTSWYPANRINCYSIRDAKEEDETDDDEVEDCWSAADTVYQVEIDGVAETYTLDYILRSNGKALEEIEKFLIEQSEIREEGG